jgi:hypothetical protein
MKKSYFPVLYIAVLFCFAGCQSQEAGHEVASTRPKIQNPPKAVASINLPMEKKEDAVPNFVNFNGAKVGSQYGTMKLEKVDAADTSKPASAMNFVMNFSGTAEVRGAFRHLKSSTGKNDGKICFDGLTPGSLQKLPTVKADDLFQSFCLRDSDAAKKEFGSEGTNGFAVLTVSNYQLVNAAGGGNLADFVGMNGKVILDGTTQQVK